MFVSGDMNMDSTSLMLGRGENLATLDTAVARPEATLCAAGLRGGHARSTGLGRSMVTSLERLPKRGLVSRVRWSHWLGYLMKGCFLMLRWLGQTVY